MGLFAHKLTIQRQTNFFHNFTKYLRNRIQISIELKHYAESITLYSVKSRMRTTFVWLKIMKDTHTHTESETCMQLSYGTINKKNNY